MQPHFLGSLRRVAWLMGLLIASLVATGLLQFIFVLQLNSRFRSVVVDVVPDLNRSQTISMSAAEVHRQILNGLLTDVLDERESSLQKCRLAMLQVDALWDAAVPVEGKSPDLSRQVLASWRDYQSALNKVLDAAEKGQREEALKLRRLELRGKYDNLVAALQTWGSQSGQSARQAYLEASDELAQKQMILLLLCGWPFAVALLGMFALFFFWFWISRGLPDESGILSRD